MGWFKLPLLPADRRAWRPAAEPTVWRPLGVACLPLVCALLVSCGGEPRLAPSDPLPWGTSKSPAAAAATPFHTAVESRIGDIIWATATDPTTNAPMEPVSSYRPDAPRIIAAMQSHALPAGSIVEATWEYNDTSLDAFATQLSLPESGAEQWMSFHIARDPAVPWPVGTYEVTISLGGATVQRASVEVTDQP